MSNKKHIAHRILKAYSGAAGIRYIYRGVFIECVGYFDPEHCVCWQGIDFDGIGAFAHNWSLAGTKKEIDRQIDEYDKSPWKGYDDKALEKMGISKEIYLKFKDK